MKFPKLNKKGFSLGDLPVIAVSIGVGAIVLGYVAKILDELDDDLTGTAGDVVKNGSSATLKIGKQLPTLGLVVAAALIIGVIATSFYLGKRTG